MKQVKSYPTNEMCMYPEHNPPMHIVLEPGEYEHECPACRKKQKIVVPLITV
jgi:hypothetical protein